MRRKRATASWRTRHPRIARLVFDGGSNGLFGEQRPLPIATCRDEAGMIGVDSCTGLGSREDEHMAKSAVKGSGTAEKAKAAVKGAAKAVADTAKAAVGKVAPAKAAAPKSKVGAAKAAPATPPGRKPAATAKTAKTAKK